jgi:molybdenum cofactor biosynthesis enzyme MoaA
MDVVNTGCMMCHSLYVKANGDIPCWDDVGEDKILWNINQTDSSDGGALFHHGQLLNIRRRFAEGKEPFPNLCNKCAVRGCGRADTSHPRTMQVLHLESSYLCHLSCTQCIPASLRTSLQGPPYHMTTFMLENVLRRLRAEGIHEIHFVHFEGRGDPLATPSLGKLVELAKQYYPRSFVGATTHGSYRYRQWLVECGLDFLRVSVDGATPESYSKYRIGGDFHKVMAFLYALRDSKREAKSALQVEWKYILFEWNDSDSEIQTAARLASELEVRLHFVITHTPGRSRRFPSVAAALPIVTHLAPGTTVDSTFQLRSPEERAVDAKAVIAQHVVSLLSRSLEMIREKDAASSLQYLRAAVNYDPGLRCACNHANAGDLIEFHLDDILANANSPGTLSWLAAISREYPNKYPNTRLLLRYLDLAPDAPDRDHVFSDLQPFLFNGELP